MNETGNDCPVVEFNNVSTPVRNIGIFLVALSTAVYIFLVVMYIKASGKCSLFASRQFFLSLVGAFGCWFQVLWIIREIVGRENFPCALYIALPHSIIALQAVPYIVRLGQLYHGTRLKQLLSQAKYESAMNEVLVHQAVYVSSDRSANNLDDNDLDFNELSNRASLSQDATSSTGSDVYKLPLKLRKQLKIHRLLSSNSMSYFTVLVVFIWQFVHVVLSTKDVVLCTGCEIEYPVSVIILAVIGGILIGFYSYEMRHEPDPLQLRFEFLIHGIFLAFWLVTVVIQALTKNKATIDGTWSFDYHWPIVSIIFMVIAVAVPMYYGKKEYCKGHQPHSQAEEDAMEEEGKHQHKLSISKKKKKTSMKMRSSAFSSSILESEVTLYDILGSESGRNLFKSHLVAELSIENYLFYEDVNSWKAYFDSPQYRATTKIEKKLAETNFEQYPGMQEKIGKILANTKQKMVCLKKAKEKIVSKYVKTSAPFEVNISYSARQTVLNNLERIEKSDFDKALLEVYHMMATHSFPRFVRSKYFNMFVGRRPIEGKQGLNDSGSL